MAYRRRRYSTKKRKSAAATRIQRAWRSRKARTSTKKLRSYTSGFMHNFKRVEVSTNQSITTNAITDPNPGFFGIGYQFQLDDVQDYTAFPNLFDSYKIAGVSFEIIPVRNSYSAPNVMPQIMIATDYDDAVAPVNMEKMLCRAGCRATSFSRKVNKYFAPRVSSNIYNPVPAVTNGFAPKRTWLDLTSPGGSSVTVPHYGIKLGFQADPGQNIQFHLKKTYYLKFKEPVVR